MALEEKNQKRLTAFLLLALSLGLGACSGLAPSTAIHEATGDSRDGAGSSVATIAEPNNTPMPTGNVAPAPDPHCEGEGCLRIWHWEVKAEVQCRLIQSEGSPYRVRFSGFFQADDGTVYSGKGHKLRVVDEGRPVPQYFDIALQDGGTFELIAQTEDPLKASFYGGGNPPVSAFLQHKQTWKDCPGLECIEGMMFQKWDAHIALETPQTVLPCLTDAESEVPVIPRSILNLSD